jgi:hypothetical protein
MMNNSGGNNTAYGGNKGLSPKNSNASNGNGKANNHATKPGMPSVSNF